MRPDPNFNGDTSFTVTVNDQGHTGKNARTVQVQHTVRVNAINDPPRITVPPPITFKESEDTKVKIHIPIEGVVVEDVDSDEITITITPAETGMGTIRINNKGNYLEILEIKNKSPRDITTYLKTLEYSPENTAVCSHALVVVAFDGTLTVEKQIGISLGAINDPPFFKTPTKSSANVDIHQTLSLDEFGIIIGDPDAENGALQVQVSVDSGALESGHNDQIYVA